MVAAPPRLAITLGDPAGIGAEVTLDALIQNRNRSGNVILIGSSHVAKHPAIAERISELTPLLIRSVHEIPAGHNGLLWLDPSPDLVPHFEHPGHADNGRIAYQALRESLALVDSKIAYGIVTAPIDKSAMKAAGSPYWDHTSLLAAHTAKPAVMAFFSESLRMSLTTIHVPLRAVSDMITPDRLAHTIRCTHKWLIRLGYPTPRIAVAGLNPHAGENGLIGSEDDAIIRPVIKGLQSEFPEISGPYPGDTVFRRAIQGEFDCVIAQYHDQGLIPLKLVGFDDGVNVTLGIPFIRTSPDHGTAYDIAYQNKASCQSMAAAIALAERMQRGR
ncbi:4-hydroxythreonine-4-phosphate dehydrogenase PdxA [bacterium]|nr:4-hydroxythreonine-4-phosphate dehydrogenase PdxA [bacterium]